MTKLKTTSSLLLAVTMSCAYVHAQVKQATITSPDHSIEFILNAKGKQLSYQVKYHNQNVINSSALGLTVNDKEALQVERLQAVQRRMINESYTTRGLHSKAHNYCNDVVFAFSKAGAPESEIEVKVFNDGVAFRYLIAAKDSSHVNADNTWFAIANGSTIWSQDDINGYEGKYKQQRIEDVKEDQLAGPPLTIQLPEHRGYAAITEGGVLNFAGMSLKATSNHAFKANLKGITALKGRIETPWRIVEIGKDLNTLVNSDIIANVSPAPDQKLFPQGPNTDWIKPGKSVWSWLAANGNVTFENMKRYSEWARKLGIEYNLVDEGWSKWKDGTKDNWELMKELVEYSNARNVKVWVWKSYPESNGVPGLKDPRVRHEFFEHCKQIGVTGLKIDFFDTESQEVLDFYQQALEDAAKLHLMLDFHGADKPTGQSRTWPNEMSREGIRGLENTTSWPAHDVTLPFTRYLAGHADYTPLSFRQDLIKGTTLAHQIATVVTFTSPFMCLAVNPEALLGSPVQKIITDLPTTWDETRVLPQSEIGKLAVYARRKGSTWYLSVLNGETSRKVKINLAFLGNGNYHSMLVDDDKDSPEKVSVNHKTSTSKDAVTVDLQSGGGFVAKFSK